MDIKELYKIIKQKKESAKNEMIRINKENEDGFLLQDLMKLQRVKGNYNAYVDILCLIESRGALK